MVIVGIPLIACCVGLMYMSLQSEKFPDALSVVLLILGLAMAVGLGLGILDMLKSTLSFSEEGIRVVRLFGTKEVAFSEFKGMTSDENYVYLHPQDETQKRFKISTYFAKEPEWYRLLLSLYPELDQQDLIQNEEELLQNKEYGESIEERQSNTAWLKKTVSVLNTLTFLGFFWGLTYPYPYELAIGTNLALPIAAWILVLANRGRLKVIEFKNSAFPTIGLPIVGPPVVIWTRWFIDYTMMDYAIAWRIALIGPPLLFLAIILGARSAFSHKSRIKGYVQASLLFLYTGFSFFALSCSINCTFDNAPPERFEATVLKMDYHSSSKGPDTYYLTLSSWGIQKEGIKIGVSEDLYNRITIGDSVRVFQKPGLLDMPWVYVKR